MDNLRVGGNKIPRPRSAARNCRNINQIAELTGSEKQQLLKFVPKACNTFFNLDKCWKAQDKQKRRSYFERMAEELPFLRRYVNLWPAEVRGRIYLNKRRAKRKLHIPKAQSKAGHLKTHHSDAVKPETDSDSESLAPVSGSTRTHFKAVEYCGRAQPHRATLPRHSESCAQRAQAAQAGPGTPSATAKGSIVTDFLRTLVPEAAGLAPAFVRGGVVEEVHLLRLAAMPRGELHEFLSIDLELNPFQCRLVRIALHETYRDCDDGD